MATITVGVDIGQKVDPTALAVVEAQERSETIHYLARHLERLPLGTPYPEVASRLERIKNALEERYGKAHFYVDATGVGQPVVNLLRKEDLYLTSVYITSGQHLRKEGLDIYLPKALLVSRLQVLLQTGRIHLPKTSEAETLAKELLDYEIKVEEDGKDSYGAFRVGSHDDLVTALGLAVFEEHTKAVDIGIEPDEPSRWSGLLPELGGQPRIRPKMIF
jgi:hypothetical protein